MRKIYSLLIIILFSLLALPLVNAATPDISITVDFPDNQRSEDSGYFDLLVKPGEAQELKLNLKNVSTEDREIMVKVNTATTSPIGGIDYGQPYKKENKDPSLLYPLSEILVPEQEQIKIAAGEESTVTFKLNVPAERFEGVVLGAIQVIQLREDAKEESSNKEGVVINNRFAYSIGVNLTEEIALSKQSQLELTRVEANQQTGRNHVFAYLHHSTADIVEKVTYEGKVTRKNSEEILHSGQATNYRIAPNSAFYFPISWENQRFEAGEYVLKLTAKSEETGDTWAFEEPFTISRKKAQELNEKAVDLGTDYRRWLIIGGFIFLGLIILVMIVVIVILVIRKKKRAKRRAQRRRKKSSRDSSSSKRKSSPRQGGKQ